VAPILRLVAPKSADPGTEYRRFVEEGLRDPDASFAAQYRAPGLGVGTEPFREHKGLIAGKMKRRQRGGPNRPWAIARYRSRPVPPFCSREICNSPIAKPVIHPPTAS
jgi:hypothetical protein